MGIVLVNVSAICVIVYSQAGRVTEDSVSSDLEDRDGADKIAASALPLPDRPEFATTTADEGQDEASAILREVEQLQTKAFDLSEEAFEKLPSNPGALALLGRLHSRSANTEVALQMWEKALEIDPEFSDAWCDLGQFALKRGELEEAKEYLASALRFEPENMDARRAFGDVLLELGEYEEAIRNLKFVVQKGEESPSLWCNIAAAHLQLKNYDQAILGYNYALRLDAQSRTALVGLMNVYRKSGDKERAASVSAKVAAIESADKRTVENRDVVGRDLVKLQELLAYTAVQSSMLFFASKDYATAIQQLEDTLELMPDSLGVSSQLATFYASTGEPEKAFVVYENLCARTPDSAIAWQEYAMLAIKLRRLEVAEKALQEIVQLNPNNAKAYALLAQTQMPSDRNPSAAVVSASRAVELDPSAANHYVLGTAHFYNGDSNKARAEIEKALELEPNNAEFREALGNL